MALLPPRRGVVLPPLKRKVSPNVSSRRGARVSLIVVHSTEGAYEGAVSWLCNPQAQASAHLVLREDGGEATQLVPFAEKAWHVADYNGFAVGLECAGFSGKLPDQQLRVAARIVAALLHRFDLPARYVGGDVGKAGFSFHQDLGLAGGGHHDPGLHGLRKWQFVALVKWEARRGGFRPWGE